MLSADASMFAHPGRAICWLVCFAVAARAWQDWQGYSTWQPGSSRDTGWVPGALNDCASKPPIISYHIHVLYRGSNKTNVKQAFDAHARFIAHINESMAECTHAHMGKPQLSSSRLLSHSG